MVNNLEHPDFKWLEGSKVSDILRAIASMRQTEALASVVFFFFLFNTLNTWEENLTMDIASVITFFGYGPDTCTVISVKTWQTFLLICVMLSLSV